MMKLIKPSDYEKRFTQLKAELEELSTRYNHACARIVRDGERIILMDEEIEALGILLSNLIDVELERDILRRRYKGLRRINKSLLKLIEAGSDNETNPSNS